MCLYPKLIENRKYKANKKNGGIIPPVFDKRTLMVPVGCGKCIECKKQKARNWQVRLQEEIRHDKTGQFVTLTFSDEEYKKLSEEITGVTDYNLDNEIATLGTRRFLERWRKKYKTSVKHWLVTELGHNGTENIHIHGLLWTNENKETIEKIWKYGWIYIGEYTNEKTINYIVKYVNKTDKDHPNYNSKVLTSAGIGKKYLERPDSKLNKYKGEKTNETYKTRQGIKLNMPIYYRNQIYTEEEREKLWLQKLDKEERWVCGEKIDISENEIDYYKTREFYRMKNKRLGYGSDEIDYEKRRYEINRRKIQHWTRLKKAEKKEELIKKGIIKKGQRIPKEYR
jgi:hypothetical protein